MAMTGLARGLHFPIERAIARPNLQFARPARAAYTTACKWQLAIPLVAFLASIRPCTAQESPAPRPPAAISAADKPLDKGKSLLVTVQLSPDDDPEASPKRVEKYVVYKAGEFGGLYVEAGQATPTDRDYRNGDVEIPVEVLDAEIGEPYWFRAFAVGPEGARSTYVETTEPVRSEQQMFDGGRFWLAVIVTVVCSAVVLFILLARTGRPLYIRKIAGLDAIEEAVGRATEMGRPCLFVPGIQDMNEIQTIAGLTILSRVAARAAEYDATVEVPTSRSLVMTAARETVQAAFIAAGRPDAYNEDRIYYVTDEQFGFVAYLTGHMVREKPAACFYMGSFFAESLILAETGNSIGAIQVAGTAQPSQLPFFVAACDYTLIGEEFFAASAYLSGDPDQLGSLKGQDVGKIIVGVLLVVGCGLFTLASLSEFEQFKGMSDLLAVFRSAAEYLRDTVLSSG
jgi:hypothetical protein